MMMGVFSSYLREIRDAEDEANGIQNVRFSTAVQSGDGVEILVELRDDGALRVRLEAIDADFLDVHIIFYYVWCFLAANALFCRWCCWSIRSARGRARPFF